jgi:transposase
MQVIGIDISKNKFDAAIYNEKTVWKEFSNSPQGFTKFVRWLNKEEKASVCMEATGFYGEQLAEFLYAKGHKVSIINPSCIKAYAQSKLSRHKTDKVDAQIIAEYAYKHDSNAWKPTAPELKELRQLHRCREALMKQLGQVSNQLENKLLCLVVKKVWKSLYSELKKQIKEIELMANKLIAGNEAMQKDYKNLQSIPGISNITARAILAEVPDLLSFKSARQLAAYAGLVPRQRTSGLTVRGKSKLSKLGSSNLRRILYLPSIVARKYNPIIASFSQKLALKGKCKMSIIGAAMRKLIHIIYGVLKHKTAFNPSIDSCLN